MNAWTPSPSPSLDVFSSDLSSALWHVVSTLPRRLWDAYVAYLWFHQPNSWVGRLASAFRILAVVLVLPVIILTLLDVSSYVIARTLGVVDDVKASTSDAGATTAAAANMITTERNRTVGAVAVPSVTARVPSCDLGIGIGMGVDIDMGIDIGAPVRTSEGLASEDSVRTRANDDDDGDGHGCVSETGVGVHAYAHAPNQSQSQSQIQTGTETRPRMWMRSADQDTSDASPQTYYFAGEEDLRLAGEGVFSPAVSMPPSPVTPRMSLHAFTESDNGVGQVSEVEGIVLRRRVQGVREDKPGHT